MCVGQTAMEKEEAPCHVGMAFRRWGKKGVSALQHLHAAWPALKVQHTWLWYRCMQAQGTERNDIWYRDEEQNRRHQEAKRGGGQRQ